MISASATIVIAVALTVTLALFALAILKKTDRFRDLALLCMIGTAILCVQAGFQAMEAEPDARDAFHASRND